MADNAPAREQRERSQQRRSESGRGGGSAGLKPCLFSLDVLNKGHAAASPLHSIDAHDVALFQRYSDAQCFSAAEELVEIALL